MMSRIGIRDRFWHCRRRLLSVAVLLCVVFMLGGCGVRQQTVIWKDNLDKKALELDGKDYVLRDLAFYVAYEERVIYEQALVYDPKNPDAYWNTHMNGNFVRVRARQEIMNQAVHDFIFLELAREMDMELSEDEIEYAKARLDDFWMDLGETGQQGICVSREELEEDILCMALAQKCQKLQAAMAGVPPEDYDIDGAAYEKLLAQHSYKIRDRIWDGINIGHITLE